MYLLGRVDRAPKALSQVRAERLRRISNHQKWHLLATHSGMALQAEQNRFIHHYQ